MHKKSTLILIMCVAALLMVCGCADSQKSNMSVVIPGVSDGSQELITDYLSDDPQQNLSERQVDGRWSPVSKPGADPVEGSAPLSVHFFDNGSYSPRGLPIIKWFWKFQKTDKWWQGWHDCTATRGDTGFIYEQPGSYKATLVVVDERRHVGWRNIAINVVGGSSGALTISVATDAPVVQQVPASYGSTVTAPTFFRMELSATNEEIAIEAIRVRVADAGNGNENDAFAGPVRVYEGGTMVSNALSGGALIGSGHLSSASYFDAAADIVFDSPLRIATNGSRYLTLVADLNSVANGADSGDTPYLGLDYNVQTGMWSGDYSGKYNVRAIGTTSGEMIYTAASEILKGNAVYIVKTKLGMAVNSASPSGTSVRQADHTIFKMDLTNTSADTDAQFRSGQSYDPWTTDSWSSIGGTTVSISRSTYVTPQVSTCFSEADLDAGDGMSFDTSNSSTMNEFTRVSFWVRVSATGVSNDNLRFIISDVADLSNVLQAVTIPKLNPATWCRVDALLEDITGARYFGIVVNVDTLTTESIFVDNVMFYDDCLQLELVSNGGLFNTASPTNIPVWLKDPSFGPLAIGYVSGVGEGGLSTNRASVTFIPQTGIPISASGRMFNVVVDTTALMTATSKDMTMSIGLGSASSAGAITAGNILWNDNSSSSAIGWVDSLDNSLIRTLNF